MFHATPLAPFALCGPAKLPLWDKHPDGLWDQMTPRLGGGD